MTVFRDILCVVNIWEDSAAALDRAVALAKTNQARLTVVNVLDRASAGFGLPDGGPISTELQSKLKTARMDALEALVNPYRQQIPVITKVLIGTHFLETIRQVLIEEHDLVIKIPEELAWLDRLFGSDDMNLLRECPCPVWLVKPQTEKPCRRILAAVDVDNEYPRAELQSRYTLNQKILEMAGSLAVADFADLHVVNAWQAIAESAISSAFMQTPEEKILAYIEKVKDNHLASLKILVGELTAGLGKEAVEYINLETHLVKGLAHKEIPALARQLDVDLIVMGTVGRTGIPGFFMGNTAETILNQIDCSVLAIKPPGFETPVELTD